MSLPQLPKVDMNQAVADVVEAMALQGAAVASLINAEAAKVDALVAAGMPAAASTADVESFQAAVANVLEVAAQKQQAIHATLELVRSMVAEMNKSPRF